MELFHISRGTLWWPGKSNNRIFIYDKRDRIKGERVGGNGMVTQEHISNVRPATQLAYVSLQKSIKESIPIGRSVNLP